MLTSDLPNDNNVENFIKETASTFENNPDSDIYEQLLPFRIFRIKDHHSEPIPIYGDESWINSTIIFPKKFEIKKKLYESEYIKVNLCRNLLTNEQVAVKFIKLLKPSKDLKIKTRHDRIEREISILQVLNHNYIISVMEIIKMVDCVAIVMEYAINGELFDYVQIRQKLSEFETKILMFQIFSAVDAIHNKGIIHRDLKLENILLDTNNRIKVADFGFANFYTDGSVMKDSGEDKVALLQTSCGSPCYAAPEIVLNNNGYAGFPVDIWSCGVIMFAMLFGHLPFEDQAIKSNYVNYSYQKRSSINVYQLYQYISKNALEIPKNIPVSSEAIDLIKGMLKSDPMKRITLSEIFRHSWFANSQLI